MTDLVETEPQENEPITLTEACDLYPRARLTVSTLRAESDRGHLDIFKLGRRYYTTPAAMREMIRRCQDAARHHASTSTQDASNGSSETERASSAQAALKQTVKALKAGLPRISPKSTRRNAAPVH